MFERFFITQVLHGRTSQKLVLEHHFLTQPLLCYVTFSKSDGIMTLDRTKLHTLDTER